MGPHGAGERHKHALTWRAGSPQLLCRVPSALWRTPMSSGIPVAHAAAPSPLPTRLLGQTGAAVTLFGLGGEGVLRTYDRAAEAVRVIHRALEHGVNKYPPAKPEVLRRLARPRGLTA